MRKVVVVLISVAIFLSVVTLFLLTVDNPITGHALFGSINLYINTGGPTIIIHSPLNTTYNFAIGSPYRLDLNVSTPSNNVSTWWFTLEDLFHETTINNSKIFSPNISFIAARRSNRLTVYANDTFGEIGSKSVIFYVSVPNSAPILGNISSQHYACEGGTFNLRFNATDVDEESLTTSVTPTSPFFVFPNSFSGLTFVESDLFSATLGKGDVGNHARLVSVTDGQYSDSESITISVIEINNAPVMDEIGVQTVYTQGVNSVFAKQVVVNDLESGNSTQGNLSFNISFNGGPALFAINATGFMGYTGGNVSHVGVHNITVCTTDMALSNIHQNISLCGQTGLNKTTCGNFTLTVTNQNRAPTIIDYYPNETRFNATGEQNLVFNVTTFDPDATIPDVYWYLDNVFQQYNSGNTTTWFGYTFPCGINTAGTFKAVITDGLLNDSVSWNVTVFAVSCPSSSQPSSGGGGGGGGGSFCLPQWGCNDWNVCQNTKASLDLGVISQTDYREISEACTSLGRDERGCGYQIRTCFDNMFCNSTLSEPDFLQACFYTSDPSCFDGIKNCHDGSCELLVDCGGSCGACDSCSDGIQNQGELDIDCGGPCPFQCPVETPFLKISIWRTIFIWMFWLLLLLLLILLIRRIIKLIKVHRELQKEKRIQSALSK